MQSDSGELDSICPGVTKHVVLEGALTIASAVYWPALAKKWSQLIDENVRRVAATAALEEAPGFEQPFVNQLCRAAPWKRLCRWAGKREGHINLLAMRTERELAKYLCKRGARGRVSVIQDSCVTIQAGTMGLSSNVAIGRELLRELPYVVCGVLYFGNLFGPSRLQPADDDSRFRPTRAPTAKFASWQDRAGARGAFERWAHPVPLRRGHSDKVRFVLLLLGGDVERHPGPRRACRRPSLPPVSRKAVIRAEAWEARQALVAEFQRWLRGQGRPPLGRLYSDAEALKDALEHIGRELYEGDRARSDYVNLLLGVADLRRGPSPPSARLGFRGAVEGADARRELCGHASGDAGYGRGRVAIGVAARRGPPSLGLRLPAAASGAPPRVPGGHGAPARLLAIAVNVADVPRGLPAQARVGSRSAAARAMR